MSPASWPVGMMKLSALIVLHHQHVSANSTTCGAQRHRVQNPVLSTLSRYIERSTKHTLGGLALWLVFGKTKLALQSAHSCALQFLNVLGLCRAVR
jgi:hypothetical protein